MSSLRDLALAACVAGAFPKIEGFDRLRFWRQCLASAGHARLLAQACDLDPDTAYMAGLVMRTGELLMLMTDPAAVARAGTLTHLPDSRLDHQRAVMQCSHVQVTAELARRWKFPAEMVSALAAADNPMQARPFSKLGAVLRLVSVMSDAGERKLPEVATLLDNQAELVAHLHLDLDWLAQHLQPYDTLTSGVDQLPH